MAYQFLLLDDGGHAVAHVTAEQMPRGETWRLEIDNGDVDKLVGQNHFRLVCNSDAVAALEGRLISRQGNKIVLEPLQQLGRELRENLRMPVEFDSYIYPITGAWRGREPVKSQNLSCSSLKFRCLRSLEPGERVQVVIPVTVQPVLLDVEILERHAWGDGWFSYEGKFVNLLHEQETTVREAVFGLQIRGGSKG